MTKKGSKKEVKKPLKKALKKAPRKTRFHDNQQDGFEAFRLPAKRVKKTTNLGDEGE